MTTEQMMAALAKLQAENDVLRAQATASNRINLRVSDAGYIEVYGIPGKGRFSLSNTPTGWDELFKRQAEIQQFVESNRKFAEAKLAAGKALKATG